MTGGEPNYRKPPTSALSAAAFARHGTNKKGAALASKIFGQNKVCCSRVSASSHTRAGKIAAFWIADAATPGLDRVAFARRIVRHSATGAARRGIGGATPGRHAA